VNASSPSTTTRRVIFSDKHNLSSGGRRIVSGGINVIY
jgi:hypothetical protein